jgi:hypothetical protein
MTKHVRPRGVLSLSILFLAIFPLTLLAATENRPEPVGHFAANAAGLSWQVGPQNDAVTLTITGPDDFYYTHAFASARSISLKMRDIADALSDGSYTYELRVTPRISDSVRSQLAAARARNDNAEIEHIKTNNGLQQPLVQSGSFAIVNGSFVQSDLIEPGAPSKSANASAMSRTDAGSGGSATAAIHNAPVRALDQVVADDEIVQGSLCVGLDCVNNESFGFDTIRLKENNTRIKFDDTSTSTGFPNNDWQLTANDSASGGANKFSIDDVTNSKTPFTVTGNSPTNSIFVASSGKVGFRTAAPGLDLHISTGDTPAIRQEQTNASGFTAQTWDIGGNEANWFVRDLTGGSRLPLRIRPGAPTSSVDIAASGNVGIGTASPASRLDATGTVRVSAQTVPTSGAGVEIDYVSAAVTGNVRAYDRGTSTYKSLTLNDNVTILGSASGNVGFGVSNPSSPIQHSNGATLSAGGVWTNASSRALKQDICDLDSAEALQALKEMTPVTYSYKIAPTEHHVGFIAEDVPDLVATQDRKGLSAMDVVAVLTSVVKDQQKTIDELKTRLDQIEKKQ